MGTSYEDGVRGTLEALPAGNVDLRLDGFYFAGRNTTDFWTNREPVSALQAAVNPDFANHPASLDLRRQLFDHQRRLRQGRWCRNRAVRPPGVRPADRWPCCLSERTLGRYSNFDPINLAAGLQDLTGKRLNRALRFSGTLGLQYGVPVGGNRLTARGELTYTSDYYFRPFNEPLDRQDGFVTGNAFLTYRLVGSGLQLRAFVRNIADRTILAGVFTSDLTQTHPAQYQPPRTFGGEATFRFR